MAGNEEGQVPVQDYQTDVKYMIAETESEIMNSVMGDEDPENDGDTSLEEMEDTFEDDTEPEEGEVEASAEGTPDQQTQPGEQEEYAGGEEQEQGDQQNRWVPPSRLREESERRRAAETRYDALQQQFNELSTRVMSMQPQQPPPQQVQQPEPLPPAPDRFADPEGHDRWQEQRFARMLDDRIRQVNQGWQQELQNRETTRINRSLDAAARGPRGWEFGQAYQALTSLPINPQNAAMVRAISEAPNPGDALMEWWDNNGGEQFRQNILDQLADQYGFIPPTQMAQEQRGRPNGNGQPRHVTRLPAGMRPGHRSLNNARGGGRQQTMDPEMLDDSDRSTFDFATRR